MSRSTGNKFPKSRAAGKARPKFGTHYYKGAHRYVYYVDRQPKYYFSSRPYTLEDAKAWKKRNLIWNALISVLILWIFLEGSSNFLQKNHPEMILIGIIFLAIFIYRVFMFIRFLRIDPEEDPMLKSYQCASDWERPNEDSCENCGGVFSRGVHTDCPCCGAAIRNHAD